MVPRSCVQVRLTAVEAAFGSVHPTRSMYFPVANRHGLRTRFCVFQTMHCFCSRFCCPCHGIVLIGPIDLAEPCTDGRDCNCRGAVLGAVCAIPAWDDTAECIQQGRSTHRDKFCDRDGTYSTAQAYTPNLLNIQINEYQILHLQIKLFECSLFDSI